MADLGTCPFCGEATVIKVVPDRVGNRRCTSCECGWTHDGGLTAEQQAQLAGITSFSDLGDPDL